jgi:hypothetical protein
LIVDKGIKDLYELKLVNVQYHELLDRMCKEVSSSEKSAHFKEAIFRSIARGNFEFVFRIVKAKSNLLWCRGEDSMSIFAFAILHRQPKIFSLMYGLPVKVSMATSGDDKGNVLLHMTGRIEASILLNQIQGAALQMQRELQWFKVIFLVPNFSLILSQLTSRNSSLQTKWNFIFYNKICFVFYVHNVWILIHGMN